MTKVQTSIELQRCKLQESSSYLTDQPPMSWHEVSTSPPQLVTELSDIPQISTSSPQLDGTQHHQ